MFDKRLRVATTGKGSTGAISGVDRFRNLISKPCSSMHAVVGYFRLSISKAFIWRHLLWACRNRRQLPPCSEPFGHDISQHERIFASFEIIRVWLTVKHTRCTGSCVIGIPSNFDVMRNNNFRAPIDNLTDYWCILSVSHTTAQLNSTPLNFLWCKNQGGGFSAKRNRRVKWWLWLATGGIRSSYYFWLPQRAHFSKNVQGGSK